MVLSRKPSLRATSGIRGGVIAPIGGTTRKGVNSLVTIASTAKIGFHQTLVFDQSEKN